MNSPRTNPSGAVHLRHESFADTGDLLACADAAALDDDGSDATFFWHDPSTGRSLLAVGAVQHFIADGPSQLAAVAAHVRAALGDADSLGCGGLAAVGGFAFADPSSNHGGPLPGCWFFLPRRLWRQEHGTTHVVEIDAPAAPLPPLHPAEVCSREDVWEPRVASALDHIRRGDLDKVVLSRRRRLPLPQASLRRMLRSFRAARPACVTFAVRLGATAFFGSTPEWMVRLDARGLHAPALAGTYPRGDDASADDANAAALLACIKNRREHRAVVDGIVRSLKSVGVQPEVDDTRVLRLPEAMHLRTEITGRVPNGIDALRLAAALHPTPAVCGTPRSTAAAFLREHEAERGWYTGGVGWMDGRGHGEVVVGLRSALRDATGLTVFAGAGIVAGSDAGSELAETEIKMNALLAPLRTLEAESGD